MAVNFVLPEREERRSYSFSFLIERPTGDGGRIVLTGTGPNLTAVQRDFADAWNQLEDLLNPPRTLIE